MSSKGLLSYEDRVKELLTPELLGEIICLQFVEKIEVKLKDKLYGEYEIFYTGGYIGIAKAISGAINLDTFCFKCIDYIRKNMNFEISCYPDTILLRIFGSNSRVVNNEEEDTLQESIIKATIWVQENYKGNEFEFKDRLFRRPVTERKPWILAAFGSKEKEIKIKDLSNVGVKKTTCYIQKIKKNN